MAGVAGTGVRARAGRQAGIALLEALFALLLLAGVLLGTAAGLLHATQASQAALLHGQAVQWSAELGERLRSTAEADHDAVTAGWIVDAAAVLPAPAANRPGAAVQDRATAVPGTRERRVQLAWREPRGSIARREGTLVLPQATGPVP